MDSSLNSQNAQIDFTHQLQDLMQRVGVSSFKSLSRAAGVSEGQILRLRRGKVEQMRVDGLLKLSKVLQVSLSELVATFSVQSAECQLLSMEGEKRPDSVLSNQQSMSERELLQQITDSQTEYQRLLLVLEQQRAVLLQEFQQSSLQLLESLLVFWPTAAQKAQEDPEFDAKKLVTLVQKPLDQLLQAWGVEAIAPVGAELPYNPQRHQLIEGYAQPGATVKVRYTGYCQGEKLLYRAKVRLISTTPALEGGDCQKGQD